MTNGFSLRIRTDDLGAMFGRPVETSVGSLVGLDYRDADDTEITEVRDRLTAILADETVGASGLERWEEGWAEVRVRVTREGVSDATLAPQYFRHRTLRLRGRYIRTRSTNFEPKLYRALKDILFRRYLGEADQVIELGCGTGLNLLQLHRLFPAMPLVGCDWARPSQELIALIAAATGAPLAGACFDMRTLEGREAIAITPGTAVMTLHAMEQLGRDFGPLLEFLITARPKLVLHLEPALELYDPADPFDAAAIAYHRKRGYLEGFLPALTARADVEILETRRLGFGAAFHEAYTVIAWRPRSASRD
jgi:hypothetical protein